MITKRNKVRVRLAEILHTSGVNQDRALNVVGYPTVRHVQASGVTEGNHNVAIRDEISRVTVSAGSGQPISFLPGATIRPESTSVEIAIERPATGNWSVDKTLLTVDYSDGTRSGIYVGNPQSGTNAADAVPVVRNSPLPAPPRWPVPAFLKAHKVAESEKVKL